MNAFKLVFLIKACFEVATCALMVGRVRVWLADLPPQLPSLPPTQPNIHSVCNITVVVKTISKTSNEYCAAELLMKH